MKIITKKEIRDLDPRISHIKLESGTIILWCDRTVNSILERTKLNVSSRIGVA